MEKEVEVLQLSKRVFFWIVLTKELEHGLGFVVHSSLYIDHFLSKARQYW